MKILASLLSVVCFAVVGCHSHPHGEGGCCGTDGKCCKTSLTDASSKTCAPDCEMACCKKAE